MTAEILMQELKLTMCSLAGISLKLTDDEKADIIITAVLVELDIDRFLFESPLRKREIVEARMIAVYLLKKHTNYRLKAIAKMIGNRDHSTVLYANTTAQNLLLTSKEFRNSMQKVELTIQDI